MRHILGSEAAADEDRRVLQRASLARERPVEALSRAAARAVEQESRRARPLRERGLAGDLQRRVERHVGSFCRPGAVQLRCRKPHRARGRKDFGERRVEEDADERQAGGQRIAVGQAICQSPDTRGAAEELVRVLRQTPFKDQKSRVVDQS